MGGVSTTAPEALARERELNSLYIVTVVVVLVIVTVTFGALIFAFLWRSQNGYLWQHLRIPWLLWVTTAILAASSWLLERARGCLKAAEPARFYRLVQWTTGLGVLFLLGQGAAWWQVVHSRVLLAQDKHAWFIFLFSGMHALHILAGLGGLAYLLYRAREPASGPRYQMTTRAYTNALAIFWHYLGFVWVVLFVLLLTWRR
jgi:cytochrome c oxidase subunit 3